MLLFNLSGNKKQESKTATVNNNNLTSFLNNFDNDDDDDDFKMKKKTQAKKSASAASSSKRKKTKTIAGVVGNKVTMCKIKNCPNETWKNSKCEEHYGCQNGKCKNAIYKNGECKEHFGGKYILDNKNRTTAYARKKKRAITIARQMNRQCGASSLLITLSESNTFTVDATGLFKRMRDEMIRIPSKERDNNRKRKVDFNNIDNEGEEEIRKGRPSTKTNSILMNNSGQIGDKVISFSLKPIMDSSDNLLYNVLQDYVLSEIQRKKRESSAKIIFDEEKKENSSDDDDDDDDDDSDDDSDESDSN
jgi:hypothetical protein